MRRYILECQLVTRGRPMAVVAVVEMSPLPVTVEVYRRRSPGSGAACVDRMVAIVTGQVAPEWLVHPPGKLRVPLLGAEDPAVSLARKVGQLELLRAGWTLDWWFSRESH